MKKQKKPCLNCGENYLIANQNRWLCAPCIQEIKKQKNKEEHGYTNLPELFLSIWEEREHICEYCNKQLGDEPLLIYFSHEQSRGAHPERKLDKTNIKLACEKCHYTWDFGDRTKLEQNGK